MFTLDERYDLAVELRDFARSLGFDARIKQAETSTLYVILDCDDTLKIRLADHGDAYEDSLASYDPCGHTVEECRAAILAAHEDEARANAAGI